MHASVGMVWFGASRYGLVHKLVWFGVSRHPDTQNQKLHRAEAAAVAGGGGGGVRGLKKV
jgi:hypothetical protein